MIDRPLRLGDALASRRSRSWRGADDLFDPSFQPVHRRAGLARRPGRRAGVWGRLRASPPPLGAITTAPIIAYHFHQVAAGGVIGNLVLR
jgi:hypothetical protein